MSCSSAGLSRIISSLVCFAEKGLSHSSGVLGSDFILLPVSGHPVFLHLCTKRFLKGLLCIFPPSRGPAPSWDLQLVLAWLMGKPFEPLVMFPMHLLTWKTAFLVAITSARRVGERAAFRYDAPYLQFRDGDVSPALGISFLPKVVSEFQLSADIFLPTFCPHPTLEEMLRFHSLDVRCALLFYLQLTQPDRMDPNFFVSYAGHSKGHKVPFKKTIQMDH